MEDDFIIEEQRHRELLSALKGLSSLSPKEIDTAIFSEMRQELAAIKNSFDKQSQNQPNPSEEIKVTNKLLFDTLNKFETILSELRSEKPKEEWSFDVERDLKGRIINVKATQA